MLVTLYNPKHVGDVLLVICAAPGHEELGERRDNIARITDETGRVTGFNLFAASEVLGELKRPEVVVNPGEVQLTNQQVAKLQTTIQKAGFLDTLAKDTTPRFVVGKVDKLTQHPDSDHLHVAQVNLGAQTVQIVCGAPNIESGQQVVVALPGALMPNGQFIWPGQLRGVDSYGMICSARELQLTHAPQKRGIMVLADTWQPGTAFDFSLEYTFSQNVAQV